MTDGHAQETLVTMLDLVRAQMEQQQQMMQQLKEQSAARDADLQRLLSTSNSGLLTQTTKTERPICSKDAPKLLANANLNEFARWYQRWSDFVICQHLDAQTREAQVAALRSCLDDDLVRFLQQGIITVDDTTATISTYIDALKLYVRSQQNPLLDRIKFFQRQQETGESFDEFLATVKELKIACDFSFKEDCDNCRSRDQEILRDKIVSGVRDQSTRHKLLAADKLTLDQAVQFARAEEVANVTRNNLTGSASVQAVKKQSSYKQGKKDSVGDPSGKKCQRCGRFVS